MLKAFLTLGTSEDWDPTVWLFSLPLPTTHHSSSSLWKASVRRNVGRDPTKGFSTSVCVAGRSRGTNSISQRGIWVVCDLKFSGLLVWRGGGEVTSLSTPPTIRSSANHDDQHFPAATVQTVEDGDEGQTFEHNIKGPSSFTLLGFAHRIWPHWMKKTFRCSPDAWGRTSNILTWSFADPHTRSVRWRF